MEFKTILEIIRLQRKIILAGFAVVLLTATAGGLLMPSIYEASSIILIRTSETASESISELGNQFGLIDFQWESNIENTLEQITLTPVKEKIINSLDLLGTDGEPLEPKKLTNSNFLLYRLSPYPYFEVEQQEETTLLEITAKSSDREEAARLADTVAEIYIQDSIDQRQQDYKKIKDFLANQLASIQTSYITALEEKEIFQLENETISLTSETESAIDQLKDIAGSQRTTAENIAEVEARISLLQQQLQREKENRISSSTINDNTRIASLKAMLSNFQLDLAGLLHFQATGTEQEEHPLNSSLLEDTARIDSLKETVSNLKLSLAESLRYKTEEHPDIKTIREKISVIEKEIQDELNNLIKALNQKISKVKKELSDELKLHKNSSQMLLDLQRQLAAENAKYRSISKAFEAQLQIVYQIPGKQSGQAQKLLITSIEEERYSSLLEALYQIDLAMKTPLSDVKLLEAATVPEEGDVDSPKLILNIILGIFLGSFFGLSLGLLAEYLDDSVRTSDDLKAHGIPFLGLIPAVGKIRKKLPSIAQKKPTDPLSEQYRHIRNAINFKFQNNELKKILVTSCLAGEGKSSNIVNLGISFAKKNQVLLVDLNLRHPSLHKHFSVPNTEGMSSIACGASGYEEVIRKTGINNLDLLPAGPVPTDPGEMIESEAIKNILSEYAQKYDLLLIDSPSLRTSFDALSLSQYADGTILIIERGKLNQKYFGKILTLFADYQISPTGAILNKIS